MMLYTACCSGFPAVKLCFSLMVISSFFRLIWTCPWAIGNTADGGNVKIFLPLVEYLFRFVIVFELVCVAG